MLIQHDELAGLGVHAGGHQFGGGHNDGVTALREDEVVELGFAFRIVAGNAHDVFGVLRHEVGIDWSDAVPHKGMPVAAAVYCEACGAVPVPEADPKKNWGEVGSKVRGICYTYNHSKNFGFMRFLSKIGPGLWITDTRRTDSPYGTAFAHESAFAAGVDINLLPSREFIFEFDLIQGEKGMQAANITKI